MLISFNDNMVLGGKLMITRLIFSDSNKNLELFRKQLTMKYKTFDELALDVKRNKCGAPNKIDDFMLWQAIQSFDKQIEEQNSTIPSSKPSIIFKEELIIHTAEFYQALTPRRMELLQYIYSHEPKSVKTLAGELGRDYKNVYDDVLALQRENLLELVREGKNKRPVARL